MALPAAKRFIRPFAFRAQVGKDKDRYPIPDDGNDTQAVNYGTGYNSRYSLAYGVDPQALPVERQYFNGMFNDITSTLIDWQLFGFPEWYNYTGTTEPALFYSLGSMVRYRANTSSPWGLYRSLKENNLAVPSNDKVNWEYVPSPEEMFDSISLLDKYQDPTTVPATGDFNSITYSANNPNAGFTIRFWKDSVAQGWNNAPPTKATARAGVLEQYTITYGGGADFVVMQRYSDRLGQVYARSCSNTTWTIWINLTQKGGATGAGDDKVFYLNDQHVTANYSIPSNQNAMTAGPIVVDNGVTVSIPDGSTWTVV